MNGEKRREECVYVIGGRPRQRWVDNIRMALGEIEWVVWTGLIWLRIRTSGGLLCTR
jgi:hypothetical protein